MNNEISHLTSSAAALLAKTGDRRIRAIRSRRWVLYPRAKQALDATKSGIVMSMERRRTFASIGVSEPVSAQWAGDAPPQKLASQSRRRFRETGAAGWTALPRPDGDQTP
jgi:hypothetical protein